MVSNGHLASEGPDVVRNEICCGVVVDTTPLGEHDRHADDHLLVGVFHGVAFLHYEAREAPQVLETSLVDEIPPRAV